jgi:gamma-glutamyl phosphate reductase
MRYLVNFLAMAGLYLLWALIQFLKALWDVHRTEFTRFERFHEHINETYDDEYDAQWLTIALSVSFLISIVVSIAFITHYPFIYTDFGTAVAVFSYIILAALIIMYLCALTP